MLKLYRIVNTMDEQHYAVLAPSFEVACGRVGIAPEHAILLASPRPLQVYLLGYPENGIPHEVQLAPSAGEAQLQSQSFDWVEVFACFDSLQAAYLWVLGQLCAASYTPEAGAWIRLLQQVHQLACECGAFPHADGR